MSYALSSKAKYLLSNRQGGLFHFTYQKRSRAVSETKNILHCYRRSAKPANTPSAAAPTQKNYSCAFWAKKQDFATDARTRQCSRLHCHYAVLNNIPDLCVYLLKRLVATSHAFAKRFECFRWCMPRFTTLQTSSSSRSGLLGKTLKVRMGHATPWAFQKQSGRD